jgi:hypothetical protein
LEPEPLLSGDIVDNRMVLSASGSWTAGNARKLEALIDGLGSAASDVAVVSLDMGGVDALDTFGAWLAERRSSASPSAIEVSCTTCSGQTSKPR